MSKLIILTANEMTYLARLAMNIQTPKSPKLSSYAKCVACALRKNTNVSRSAQETARNIKLWVGRQGR